MNKLPIATATTLLPKYQELLPIFRQIAYNNGYALGLHGSGQRDMDLIAVPWTDDAVPAQELVDRLVETFDDLVVEGSSPTVKPHGRRAWAIKVAGYHFYQNMFIDLSVMPTIGKLPNG